MSPMVHAAPNRDSLASRWDVPVVPEPPNAHVVYLPPETRHPSYEIVPAPLFKLRIKRTEGGYWMVWDEPTGIFGEGEDPLQASTDFESNAVRHLNVLERQRDSLPEGQLWQLDYLNRRVRR
jgi:predicted RNase H-like HicB family nuclease